MKKSLILAAAAIAALSACTKEIEVAPINDSKAPVFTATIEPETKTQLVEGSTAGKLSKVAWLSTDEVYVLGINDSNNQTSVLGVYTVAPSIDNAAVATLTASSLKINNAEVTANNYYAVYPASISALYGYSDEILQSAPAAVLRGQDGMQKINLPATQTYNGTNISQIAPMYAYSLKMNSTELSFKNLTALLAITVSADDFSEVNNIVVKSDKAMNGAFLVCLSENENQYSISSKTATDAQKTLTLNCQNAGVNTAIPAEGNNTFYVSIPPATYGFLQFEVNGKKGSADVTKTMKTKADKNITVERKKIYPIAFADNQTPAGDPNLLKGVFTVSAGADGVAGTADDKKVKFTKANLWWDGSAYQFETDQTNYPTAWDASHIGHFFWNSNDEYITTTNGYKPYDSSHGHLSNWSTTDEFWCSEAHPLEVAGTSDLYVLSADEWKYLLNAYPVLSSGARTQTNRFAKARVNGKAGLLIFPDDYNGTTVLTGITGMCTINEDWTEAYPGESESIPTDTWSAMEAAGVVFLPAAGYRGVPNGQTFTSGYCYYWSSTPNSDNVERANGLSGNGTQFTCPGTIQRKFGSSIRLVKTVE